LVEEIERLGIARMTAFEADPVIFYYTEILDEGAWDRLWASEVHARWAEMFKSLIAFDDSAQIDARFMPEIFHLDVVSK
jgi:L-rhamnose mutarotase